MNFHIILPILCIIQQVTSNFSDLLEACKTQKCIRKCCDIDQTIQEDHPYCKSINATLPHPLITDEVLVLYNQNCNRTTQFAIPVPIEEGVKIFENMSVYVPVMDSNLTDFCVDHFSDGGAVVMACMSEFAEKNKTVKNIEQQRQMDKMDLLEACKTKKCIRKCCDINQMIQDDPPYCKSINTTLPHPLITDDISLVLYNQNCNFTTQLLIPASMEEGVKLFDNMSVYMPVMDLNFQESAVTDFCVDHLSDGSAGVVACRTPPAEEIKTVKNIEQQRQMNKVGMIISMPFLAVTFIVYALLPEKNLHQYALMIYVLALFLAYLQLVVINCFNFEAGCIVIGYSALFSFTVSFFWLNVICFDIWFTFSGFFKPPSEQKILEFLADLGEIDYDNLKYNKLTNKIDKTGNEDKVSLPSWSDYNNPENGHLIKNSRGRSIVTGRRSSEIKKLGFYSIYGFGMPLLIIILVYVLQMVVLPSDSIHSAKIGEGRCFLDPAWPSLWYLYLEAGLIIIANLVFFSWTAISIRKVKKETAMLKHSDSKRHAYEKNQKKFNLFIKLAFAMGINWSTEVISWLVNWQTNNAYAKIWIVTDCVNALYGVFIFFIFVFKRRTWRLLKRRYYAFRGKVHLAHSMGGTTTRPTNMSTTDTTVTTTTNGTRRGEDNILLHDRH